MCQLFLDPKCWGKCNFGIYGLKIYRTSQNSCLDKLLGNKFSKENLTHFELKENRLNMPYILSLHPFVFYKILDLF